MSISRHPNESNHGKGIYGTPSKHSSNLQLFSAITLKVFFSLHLSSLSLVWYSCLPREVPVALFPLATPCPKICSLTPVLYLMFLNSYIPMKRPQPLSLGCLPESSFQNSWKNKIWREKYVGKIWKETHGKDFVSNHSSVNPMTILHNCLR